MPIAVIAIDDGQNAMIHHRKSLGLAFWWLLKLIYTAPNFVRMIAWFGLGMISPSI